VPENNEYDNVFQITPGTGLDLIIFLPLILRSE
jgi:hypothetical protein